jgi:hypothetical protein
MGIPKHVSGERVLAALLDHPSGLRKIDLATVTGLSPNQVTIGLQWVRDVAASEHPFPVTWTRQAGYSIQDDNELCCHYEYLQLRSKFVSLARLMRGTIGPHAVLHPEDEWARRASNLVTATCDSLELLLGTSAA